MKIIAADITERGVDVQSGSDDAWAHEAATRALEVSAQTLSFQLKVRRDGESVRVQGDLSVSIQRVCDRCLEPVELSIGGVVDLVYVSSIGVKCAAESNLDESDLDVGWFDGLSLDMADVVSEQLALWMSDRILCDQSDVRRLVAGQCEVLATDSGPDLTRISPFANLKLPESGQ